MLLTCSTTNLGSRFSQVPSILPIGVLLLPIAISRACLGFDEKVTLLSTVVGPYPRTVPDDLPPSWIVFTQVP